MPRVERWFLGVFRGRINCTFDWTAIDHRSVVLISASEGVQDVTQISSTLEPERFVGAALITVHNIAPFGVGPGEGFEEGGSPPPGGGVRFVVTVDWDEPLPICVDIVLLDEQPRGWATSRR